MTNANGPKAPRFGDLTEQEQKTINEANAKGIDLPAEYWEQLLRDHGIELPPMMGPDHY